MMTVRVRVTAPSFSSRTPRRWRSARSRSPCRSCRRCKRRATSCGGPSVVCAHEFAHAVDRASRWRSAVAERDYEAGVAQSLRPKLRRLDAGTLKERLHIVDEGLVRAHAPTMIVFFLSVNRKVTIGYFLFTVTRSLYAQSAAAFHARSTKNSPAGLSVSFGAHATTTEAMLIANMPLFM